MELDNNTRIAQLESELVQQDTRYRQRLESMAQRIRELDGDAGIHERRIQRLQKEKKDSENSAYEYSVIVSRLEEKIREMEQRQSCLEVELRQSRDTYFRHLSSCKSDGKHRAESAARLCTELPGPTVFVEMNSRLWDVLKTYHKHLSALVNEPPVSMTYSEPVSSKPVSAAPPPEVAENSKLKVLSKSPSSPALRRKPSKQFEHVAAKVDSNFDGSRLKRPSVLDLRKRPMHSSHSYRKNGASSGSGSPSQDKLDKTVLLNIIHQQGFLLEQSMYAVRDIDIPSVQEDLDEPKVDAVSNWKVFDAQRTSIAREWASLAAEKSELSAKTAKLEKDTVEYWHDKVFELFDRLGRVISDSADHANNADSKHVLEQRVPSIDDLRSVTTQTEFFLEPIVSPDIDAQHRDFVVSIGRPRGNSLPNLKIDRSYVDCDSDSDDDTDLGSPVPISFSHAGGSGDGFSSSPLRNELPLPEDASYMDDDGASTLLDISQEAITHLKSLEKSAEAGHSPEGLVVPDGLMVVEPGYSPERRVSFNPVVRVLSFDKQ